MTILPYKSKFIPFVPFFLLAIVAVGLIEAKKSSKNQPPKSSNGNSTSGGGSSTPSLTAGKLKCTNGRNRCLHAWETMFYGVTPYEGTGLCAPRPFHPKADVFSPVCQFDTSQTAKMVLACGSASQTEGKDTVTVVYDGVTATATTSGAARAVFASSEPQGKLSLKSGTITATDANMDLWIYCFDEWPLYLVHANGDAKLGTPSCPDGQSKCVYAWKGNFERMRPNEGKAVCSESDTPGNEFYVACSLTKQQASHYPIACAEPAVSTIDVTYDANGNGQAVSTGQAKALFAQSLPYDVNALLSGTVTSSVANENLYVFCPESY